MEGRVQSIEIVENEDVYDITVSDLHSFFAEGILVKNCGEILLRPNGLCNLSEVVVRENDDLDSLKRKVRIAAIIGTFQSTLTNFRYVRSIWSKNANEERLLGVSLTGIMDNQALAGKLGLDVTQEWLNSLKEVAISTNKEFADLIGIPVSAAITTVKPSGCTTLDTQIKTEEGIKTMAEIFSLLGDENTLSTPGFSDVRRTLKVFDENDQPSVITKLFVNGVADLVEIAFEDGTTVRFTNDHKLKTSEGWKKCSDIREGDDIISF